MTRVGSGQWGQGIVGPPARVDVLIPTIGRTAELAATLASLAAQDDPAFSVIVADQSANGIEKQPAVSAMLRILRAQGRSARVVRNLPRRGMAQQRHFLLSHASASYVLFLDDDVWCEPGLLAQLTEAIVALQCGFVGAAVQGLSYLDDVRPTEHAPLEFIHGRPAPARIRPGSSTCERVSLHNAANLTHIAAYYDLPPGTWRAYKVAWVGGCVLFDRAALLSSGGFDCWVDLPLEHAGEDVAAQWRVMEAYAGVGILPSGAVHLEAPTSVTDRRVQATEIVFGHSQERQEQ